MDSNLGFLRIKDLSFEVSESTLRGRIDTTGEVYWSINVETQGMVRAGEMWSRRAYLEEYRSPARSMNEFLASPILIESGSDADRRPILPGGPTVLPAQPHGRSSATLARCSPTSAAPQLAAGSRVRPPTSNSAVRAHRDRLGLPFATRGFGQPLLGVLGQINNRAYHI